MEDSEFEDVSDPSDPPLGLNQLLPKSLNSAQQQLANLRKGAKEYERARERVRETWRACHCEREPVCPGIVTSLLLVWFPIFLN